MFGEGRTEEMKTCMLWLGFDSLAETWKVFVSLSTFVLKGNQSELDIKHDGNARDSPEVNEVQVRRRGQHVGPTEIA